MASSSEVRKYVQQVLDRHGFGHLKFGVRTVGFQDLLRKNVQVVLIKGWKPDPKARLIKQAIESRFRDVITEFRR